MDSFLGIGILELVFIVIFALIFLGPERLPQVLRDVISAIRKVRSFSSEITQHLNEEFGDLAELDPRRQIQQALNEDPKSEKKPVSKKPVAKTASTAKSTTTTKSTTAKTGTSSVPNSTTAAKSTAEKSSSVAASTSKPESDAALAAASSSAASSTIFPNGVENASTNGSVSNPESGGAVDSAPLAEEPKTDISTPVDTDTVARHDVTTGDGHLEGTEPQKEEPQTEKPAEQISPASAYFAEKAQAEKENGIHSHSRVAKHATPDPELPVLDTLAADNPVLESASDNHTIAPPELHKQEIREDESVVADLPTETLAESPSESAAKEDRA
jgi:sec-independent protein translocase protein TatB